MLSYIAAILTVALLGLVLKLAKPALKTLSAGRAAGLAIAAAAAAIVMNGLLSRVAPTQFPFNTVASLIVTTGSVAQIAPWTGPLLAGRRAQDIVIVVGSIVGVCLLVGTVAAFAFGL